MRKTWPIITLLFLYSILLWSTPNYSAYDLPPMPTDLNADSTKNTSWLTSDEETEATSLLKKQLIKQTSSIDSVSLHSDIADKVPYDSTLISTDSLDNWEQIIDQKYANNIFNPDTVLAAQNDTLQNIKLKNKQKADPLQYSTYKPNPDKTLWMALAFPGLGQINNRKYWKLPIIYAGVAGITYAISWNAKSYSDYSRGYRDLLDSNPNTNSYVGLVPNGYPESQWESYLEGKQSTFRRYRDLSIIIGVAFYAITVVDAFVDASLASFEVSPDLSMKIKPKFDEQPNTVQPSMSCAVQLNF